MDTSPTHGLRAHSVTSHKVILLHTSALHHTYTQDTELNSSLAKLLQPPGLYTSQETDPELYFLLLFSAAEKERERDWIIQISQPIRVCFSPG